MNCDAQRAAVNAKMTDLKADLEKRSADLSETFKREASDIEPDIDTSGPDAWVGADVEISWKTVDLSLDLPMVTVRDQEWSLDLPQVTMNDQRIVFDTPSLRMETQRIGEYPEFYCDTSRLIPECTVRMSPIYMDMPVFFMERHEIVLGVPEFRMDRTSLVLGVPEFEMRTLAFTLDLPQITLKNIEAGVAETKERAEALSERAKAESDVLRFRFAEEAKSTIGYEVNGMFDCFQSELQQQKNQSQAMFESGLASLQAGIASMVANRVPEDNETLVKMRTQLAALQEKTKEFSENIARQFTELDAQRRDFVNKLLGL